MFTAKKKKTDKERIEEEEKGDILEEDLDPDPVVPVAATVTETAKNNDKDNKSKKKKKKGKVGNKEEPSRPLPAAPVVTEDPYDLGRLTWLKLMYFNMPWCGTHYEMYAVMI